jgi:hypothetical protein
MKGVCKFVKRLKAGKEEIGQARENRCELEDKC